jgi:hypothetical protein
MKIAIVGKPEFEFSKFSTIQSFLPFAVRGLRRLAASHYDHACRTAGSVGFLVTWDAAVSYSYATIRASFRELDLTLKIVEAMSLGRQLPAEEREAVELYEQLARKAIRAYNEDVSAELWRIQV